MKDPYQILNITPDATDEQVREAYRSLARKYQPENYENSPLADMAAKKMDEINGAYDAIITMRRSQSSSAQSGYSAGYTGGGYGGASSLGDIRSKINANRIDDAETLLDGIPPQTRGAEWYFLKGTVQYKRGWLEEATKHYRTACQLDPNNPEYQAAFRQVSNPRTGGYRAPRTNAGGCSACDICTGLIVCGLSLRLLRRRWNPLLLSGGRLVKRGRAKGCCRFYDGDEAKLKDCFWGILTALSVVLMFLTGVIPFLTFALPALAGALLILIVMEIGSKWALCVYAAVSILSLLVVADKEAAMMYAAFFGYYPVIKSFLESKLPRVFEWIVKFLIFNAAMVLAYLVIIFVFGMPLDEMEEFGRYAVPILLGMGNVVFFVYDIALTRVIGAYLHRWRKSFHRLFK